MNSAPRTISDAADAKLQRHEPSPRRKEQGSKKQMLSEVSAGAICMGPAYQ